MAAKAHQPQLQDHAANAALYVTKPKAAPKHPILDEDGKLSSASAATSLKYANPTDLPSFPSAGLKLSSAGAAASLANDNQKQFQHWKPGQLPAAEKAAYLAKDYQADPSWKPEMSQAGSKAALLAARDGGHVDIWLPSESEYGQSAAGLAVGKKGLSPVIDKQVPADAHRRALMAATGAMSGSRRRAESAPQKPVQKDSPWALKAATQAEREGVPSALSVEITDPGLNASRIHNIAKNNVSRQMYTSNPPVALEVEEKNHQDTLHASAVAMARRIYAVQQNAIEKEKIAQEASGSDSHHAARKSHGRRLSNTSSISEDVPAYPQYTNLQDAAMKLAQERLDKMQDEHKQYREYYGTEAPARNRLSMRGSLRRRASSDGQLDDVDEEQSKKIRSQMSLFRSRVDEIDQKQQRKDRSDLMALAQKNVAARMSTLDEKVLSEKGTISEAQMVEWERKARVKAEKDSAVRMENYGKVGIGAGAYMDQAAIEAVARARLQPTFDDISEKAAEQRARDEERAAAQRAREEESRLDQEEKKRTAEREKARDAELKAEVKKAKEHEKEEERQRKAEEKRKSRDNKGRSLGAFLGFTGVGAATIKDDKAKEDAAASAAAATDTKDDEIPVATGDGPVVATDAPGTISAHEATTVSAHEETTTDRAETTTTETPVVQDATTEPVESAEEEPIPTKRQLPIFASTETAPPTTTKESTTVRPSTAEKDEPMSPNRRSWFSRFKRNKWVPAKDNETSSPTTSAEVKVTHSAPGLEPEPTTESSMRDVAMAGREKDTDKDDEDMYAASPPTAAAAPTGVDSPVSPLNSEDETRAAAPFEHSAATVDDEEDEEEERRGRQGRPSRAGALKQKLFERMHISKDTRDDDGEEGEADDAFEEARDSWGSRDDAAGKAVEQHEEPAGSPSGGAYAAATASASATAEPEAETKGHGSKFSETF